MTLKELNLLCNTPEDIAMEILQEVSLEAQKGGEGNG